MSEQEETEMSLQQQIEEMETILAEERQIKKEATDLLAKHIRTRASTQL